MKREKIIIFYRNTQKSENKTKTKQNKTNMASINIANRITSISFPFGDDASEFYIGFHLYENEYYDSISIYKILNELKKLSMNYKTTTNKGKKIRLVNNINGVKFELISWYKETVESTMRF